MEEIKKQFDVKRLNNCSVVPSPFPERQVDNKHLPKEKYLDHTFLLTKPWKKNILEKKHSNILTTGKLFFLSPQWLKTSIPDQTDCRASQVWLLPQHLSLSLTYTYTHINERRLQCVFVLSQSQSWTNTEKDSANNIAITKASLVEKRHDRLHGDADWHMTWTTVSLY